MGRSHTYELAAIYMSWDSGLSSWSPINICIGENNYRGRLPEQEYFHMDIYRNFVWNFRPVRDRTPTSDGNVCHECIYRGY